MSDTKVLVGASAVAIFHGISHQCDPMELWGELEEVHGGGGVEFYNYIGEWAAYSISILEFIQAEFFETTGLPGVYPYEVDEAFGGWLNSQFNKGVVPQETSFEHSDGDREYGRLAWKFFSPPFTSHGTQFSDYAEALAQRITYITGYVPPREMDGVAEVIE